VTDFLDEKRREITARLNELGPLVDEYNRLAAAASALDGIGGASVAAAAPRRGPGRPPGSSSKTATAATEAPAKKLGRPPGRPKKAGRRKAKKVGRPPGRPKAAAAAEAPAAATATTGRRRAGRRKGSGTRAAQALKLVRGQPGITIPELATKMGIKQNYLYRVLPALEQENKINKQGRGWHAKG
jgi:hypothetical protein